VSDERTKITKDHDLVQAVKMKMFGEITRKKFTWHPAKELCKRFNVPNPFPESSIVGVPELQKKNKIINGYLCDNERGAADDRTGAGVQI